MALYTDVPGVEAPAGMRAVNYESVQARMRRLRDGHKVPPAVLVARSSFAEPDDEPGEGEVAGVPRRGEEKRDGRVYYVEVVIGNQAWHRLKVAVRDENGKTRAEVLWHEKS